jgi:hypothetical protein
VRLVPVDLCCVNRTIWDPYCRDAAQFSPPSSSKKSLQAPAITNPSSNRDGLDRGNGADNFKVHRTGELNNLVLGDEIFRHLAAHAGGFRRHHFALHHILFAAALHVNGVWNRTEDIHIDRTAAVAG